MRVIPNLTLLEDKAKLLIFIRSIASKGEWPQSCADSGGGGGCGGGGGGVVDASRLILNLESRSERFLLAATRVRLGRKRKSSEEAVRADLIQVQRTG